MVLQRGLTRPPVGGPLNASHPSAFGLWAAWFAQETGGSVLYDAGRLRHGDVVGTLTREAANGLSGLRLGDSTANYAKWGTGHQFTQFTHLAVWSYTQTKAGSNQPISIMAESPGASTRDRSLFINASNQPAFYIFDGSAQTVTSPDTLVLGTTYVFAGVANGSTLKIYVNGVEKGSIAAGNAFTGFSSPELILGYGDGVSSSGTGNGLLHAHLVWSRALSDAEIARLSRDPFGLLAYRPVRLFVAAAAASGVTDTWFPFHARSRAQLANLRR